MQNIGNKEFDYNLNIEPEECNWLSLSHNFGLLAAGEKVDIVLSYNLSPIAKNVEYKATLDIEVPDSVIYIPIKISLLLNILTQETEGIKVYPNPTTGKFKVQGFNSSIVQWIEVFDIYGRRVGAHTCGRPEGTEPTLDLSNLSSGVYFVKIETEKSAIIQKIIKL